MRRTSGLDHWRRLLSVVGSFIYPSLAVGPTGTIEFEGLVRKSSVILAFLLFNLCHLTPYNHICLTANWVSVAKVEALDKGN